MNGSMSRRSILAAGVAGSAAVLLGTGHASAATLVTQSEINSQPTFYEVNGAATSFRYEPGFYSRLETWHVHWRSWTPYHWTAPHKIYSYGAYVDKPGMHGEGRAFDLARMLITNRDTGATFTAFNARYDQWKSLSGDALRTARIRYWGTMASLHYHFRHVLSYLDNADHHNHAHIDNAVSGSGDSSFATSSATQTYFVQAACQYIWGYSTGIDGDWGPQTQRDSSAALVRAGSDGRHHHAEPLARVLQSQRTAGMGTRALTDRGGCDETNSRGIGTQRRRTDGVGRDGERRSGR